MQRGVELKLLLDDGDQSIRGDSALDLHLHRVVAVAEESLGAQVLLDPFEEQSDLPTALVQGRVHSYASGRTMEGL